MSDLDFHEHYPMKYRMADEIAIALLNREPDRAYMSAHMYALTQVIEGNNPDLWRNVLAELDKLEKRSASNKLQATQQHRK